MLCAACGSDRLIPVSFDPTGPDDERPRGMGLMRAVGACWVCGTLAYMRRYARKLDRTPSLG
jgi:hypothetical protein